MEIDQKIQREGGVDCGRNGQALKVRKVGGNEDLKIGKDNHDLEE